MPLFISFQEAKTVYDEATFLEKYGAKALGLCRLPSMWFPPTGLISSEISTKSSNREGLAEIDEIMLLERESIEKWVTENDQNSGWLVRSSATKETLIDRGQFKSEKIDHWSFEQFVSVIKNIFHDFSEKGSSGKMGVMIQPLISCIAKGHLANIRRVSKTRNQWQAEINSKSNHYVQTPGRPQTQKFNSQRDDPPNLDSRLECADSKAHLISHLKEVGAWLAKNINPAVVSVEWVLSTEALWLVQCDDEVDVPDALNPKELEFDKPALAKQTAAPSPFKKYVIGSGSSLRKLKALDDFSIPGLTSLPDIYFASGRAVNAELSKLDTRISFAQHIDEFAPDGVVIRTDIVDITGTLGMNLPRTDSAQSKRACSWLIKTIENFKTDGIDLNTVYFLMHRFISARASAWSYANPTDRVVHIDSLWGIPDGIQYYPHDTFEYDLVEERITRSTLDFKPYLIWPNTAGRWQTQNIMTAKARAQSLTKSDVSYIANYTSKIAKNLNKPAQIMWFCDFPEWSVFKPPLPWYREQSAGPINQLEAAPQLPEIIIRDQQTAIDLVKNDEIKRSKLVLQPSGEIVRSSGFVESVINAAKAGGHIVIMDGSSLAHAYHQLAKAGVPIYSSRAPARKRVISKQMFGKLVRDKIPDIIAKNGDTPTVGLVHSSLKKILLISKAFEELHELALADDQSRVEEMADLYEVLNALLGELGLSWEEVRKSAKIKKEKRGAFDQGIILVGSKIPKPAKPALIPSTKENRIMVSSSQALDSALLIEKRETSSTIPILNFLINPNGTEVEISVGGVKFKMNLRLVGDKFQIDVQEPDKDSTASLLPTNETQ